MALNPLTLHQSVTVNLLLRRVFHHHDRYQPSLPPLYLTTHHRFPAFSAADAATAAIEECQPKPKFQIGPFGFSSDDAVWVLKKITHLKSPDKPDSVLRFLRETGIAEPDIRTAVLRDPLILCSSVENNWRPDVEKLREHGLSTEELSGIVASHPRVFRYNIVPKVEFWMETLGSVEHVLAVIKRAPAMVCISLENVIVPNLTFLQHELGLPVDQIIRLINLVPFLIASSPQALITKAKRAEELGCSSGMFVYALTIVGNLKQQTIESRMNNLRSLGFSREEVATIIRKLPFVLKLPEEAMSHKVEFLIEEVGCEISYLVRNPSLFTYSLEKQLVPCNLVKMILESKGFSVGRVNFCAFAKLSENQFKEKFIDPYEHAISGLHEAYIEACSRKLTAKR